MNRLLAGPELRAGAEPLESHHQRLGRLPATGKDFIDTLARSGLVGKGGAGFPVGAKWRSVAGHSHGRAVIVANGAEGEPQSKKDRVLMATRPHLVLDGAFIAAKALRARRIVLYIGEHHTAAQAAMVRALAERSERERGIVTISPAPARYVSGESSAAVHLVNAGIATPTTTPPHPHERGVEGGATLVQNVETLAHVALIARYGAASGTTLVTLAGGVSHPGVVEIEETATIGELVSRCGGVAERPRAVLLGGYFGSWLDPDLAWTLPLDARVLQQNGHSLGCGVVGVLGESRCPVCETAGIMHYLAGESSAQCGPCFFGLRALAAACSRIAQQGANREDLERLQRWTVDVRGRGACRHPDGAVVFLQSALRQFSDEFATHAPHAVRRTA